MPEDWEYPALGSVNFASKIKYLSLTREANNVLIVPKDISGTVSAPAFLRQGLGEL